MSPRTPALSLRPLPHQYTICRSARQIPCKLLHPASARARSRLSSILHPFQHTQSLIHLRFRGRIHTDRQVRHVFFVDESERPILQLLGAPVARCSVPPHRRPADATALHEGRFRFYLARRHDPIESGNSKIEGFLMRFCNSSNAMAPVDTENPLPDIPTALGQLRTMLVCLRTECVYISPEHLKRCRTC